MSDYVHKKVVRLPFPAEIKKNITNIIEGDLPYLKELLGDLLNYGKKNHFSVEYTEGGCYIDWVYYSTYGEESSDFGFVRLLTQKELNVIKPYFNKLGVNYKDEDLRVVNYCYYNCCEAPDYYNIKDDAHLFLGDK